MAVLLARLFHFFCTVPSYLFLKVPFSFGLLKDFVATICSLQCLEQLIPTPFSGFTFVSHTPACLFLRFGLTAFYAALSFLSLGFLTFFSCYMASIDILVSPKISTTGVY